jgi:hypothetical protein
MHQIEISDHLYSEASRKAAASGLSIERFVAEAVRLHLHDDLTPTEPVRLTNAQIAILRQAEADIDAGLGFTMKQVEDHLEPKKAEWRKANPQ